MQLSLSLLASLSVMASVVAKQNGDSSVTRGFLGKGTRLQPDVVAHSLSDVEEEWKDMAIAFVECNQTLSDVQDMAACARAPNAFQKSCTTVVNSVFKASNGDRDNVQEYMSEVCEQSSLTGWKKDYCRSLASNLVNSMSLDAFDNRQRLSSGGLCKTFWSQFQLAEQARLEKERVQQETIETKQAQARAEAEKKAAQERAAAEKTRIEQQAIAAKKAEAAEKKRIEQEAAAQKEANAQAAKKAEAAEQKRIQKEAAAKKEAKAQVQSEQKVASERATNEKKTAEKQKDTMKEEKLDTTKKEMKAKDGQNDLTARIMAMKKELEAKNAKKGISLHNSRAEKKSDCKCSKKSRDEPCDCED